MSINKGEQKENLEEDALREASGKVGVYTKEVYEQHCTVHLLGFDFLFVLFLKRWHREDNKQKHHKVK